MSRRDRLLWQTTVTDRAENLIGLQEQLTAQVQHGLLPILGGRWSGGSQHRGPQNQQAYDFYLRSVAVPHDPGPNKEAIKMLEWAVGIDPSYAPAWEALGQRYYFDSLYGGGGEEIFQRSNHAYERALALDPNRMMAASSLITSSRGARGTWDAPTTPPPTWCTAVRRAPTRTLRSPMCFAMRGCSTNPPSSAMRPGNSIPAIFPSVRARGLSWRWARPIAPWISFSSMLVRSGPRGSLPMCTWRRAMSRKRMPRPKTWARRRPIIAT